MPENNDAAMPEGHEKCERPIWIDNGDGSVTIRLSSVAALCLGDDLNRWARIDKAQYDLPEGWKKSSTQRENRRESVVYGNCLETVKGWLGRREVNALMRRAKETMEKPK